MRQTKFEALQATSGQHLFFIAAYSVVSFAVLLPLLMAPGVPGHITDWGLPPSQAGENEFATQTRYIWYPEGLGGLDYYALVIRPLQFVATFPILLGVSGVALVKFWIWLSFAASGVFAYFLGLEVLKDSAGSGQTRTITNLTAFASGWLFAFNPLRFNFLLSGEFFSLQIVYMTYPLTLAYLRRAITGRGRFSPHVAALLIWVSSGNPQLLSMLVVVALAFALTSWRRRINRHALATTVGLTLTLFVGTIILLSTVASSVGYLTKLQVSTNLQTLGRPYVSDWLLALVLAGYSYELFSESLGIFSNIWVVLSSVSFAFLAISSILRSRTESAVSLILIVIFATVGSGSLAPFPLNAIGPTVYSVRLVAVAFQSPVYWMFPIPLLGIVVFTHAIQFLNIRLHQVRLIFPRRIIGQRTHFLVITMILLALTAWALPLFTWRYTSFLDTYSNDPLIDSFQQKLASDSNYYRVLYVPTESAVSFLQTPYQKGGQIGRDPTLETSPKPALDRDLRVYPWSDEVTKKIVQSYSLQDERLFEHMLQVTQVEYLVVNRGASSLLGVNVTSATIWFKTLNYLKLMDQDDYISIFDVITPIGQYAFDSASPIEIQTFYGGGAASDALKMQTGSPIQNWNDHEFGSGLFGRPITEQNSSWVFFTATSGNSSGWDIYHRFDTPQSWQNASGVTFDSYGSGTGVELTLAIQGESKNATWTSSYDFLDLTTSVDSIVVPFSSFSSAPTKFTNVTLVDFVFNRPVMKARFGIGNFAIFYDRISSSNPLGPLSSSLEEKSPVNFMVTVDHSSGPIIVTLPESFSPLWSARIRPSNSSLVLPVNEDVHFLAFGYANAWIINETGSFSILLTLPAQSIYENGLALSFASFAILGFAVVSIPRWRHRMSILSKSHSLLASHRTEQAS